MKNYAKLTIYIGGLLLIGVLGVLCEPWFKDNRSVLWLDLLVLTAVYTLFIYSYGKLLVSADEFKHDVASSGIRLQTYWVYALLALAGIGAGVAFHIGFGWQALYQGAFLLIAVSGLLVTQTAAEKLRRTAKASETHRESRDSVLQLAVAVSNAAALNTQTDETTRRDLKRLAERAGHISPSSSTAARMLEEELTETLRRMQRLLQDATPAEALQREARKAETLLKQRQQTY